MADWSPPPGHAGRWIAACVGGLALGGPLGVLWNAMLLPMVFPGLAGPAAAPATAVGGAILGATLGAAQAWALGRTYRGVPVLGWIVASAAAGFLAALVVHLVFALLVARAGSLPVMAYVVAGAALKGVAAGLAFGMIQGRVLDAVVAERAAWTRVVTIGWMLGALIGAMRWTVLPMTPDQASLVVVPRSEAWSRGWRSASSRPAPSASCRPADRAEPRDLGGEVGARRRLVDRAEARAEQRRGLGEAFEHAAAPGAPGDVRHRGVFAAQRDGIAGEDVLALGERRQVEVEQAQHARIRAGIAQVVGGGTDRRLRPGGVARDEPREQRGRAFLVVRRERVVDRVVEQDGERHAAVPGVAAVQQVAQPEQADMRRVVVAAMRFGVAAGDFCRRARRQVGAREQRTEAGVALREVGGERETRGAAALPAPGHGVYPALRSAMRPPASSSISMSVPSIR